jgi:hypothetical protein
MGKRILIWNQEILTLGAYLIKVPNSSLFENRILYYDIIINLIKPSRLKLTILASKIELF